MTTHYVRLWASLILRAYALRDWPLLLWLRRQLEPLDQQDVDREVRRQASLARHQQN